MKKVGKKNTVGEGNQGLGFKGWRAPVKSQISAEVAKANMSPWLG